DGLSNSIGRDFFAMVPKQTRLKLSIVTLGSGTSDQQGHATVVIIKSNRLFKVARWRACVGPFGRCLCQADAIILRARYRLASGEPRALCICCHLLAGLDAAAPRPLPVLRAALPSCAALTAPAKPVGRDGRR